MTRKEAIEELKKVDTLDMPVKLCEAHYMSIKALEEQEPKWISVNERLPEEDKAVIASTEYGVYPEAKYTKEYGWEWAYESGADYWRKLEGVTAWMSLPKPYEAESEE